MAKKKGLVLLIFLIFIVGSVLIYLAVKNFGSDIGNIFGAGEENKNTERESITGGEDSGVSSGESDSTGGGDSRGFGGGGGGGGGGGASGGGGSSGGSAIPGTQNCYELQVPYALKNFEESSVCNNFQEGICLDKSFKCSLEVHNLDEFAGGIFKLRFVLFDKGTSFILDSKFNELFLNPGESRKVDVFFDLHSEGADGIANKEGDCRFFTESAPKKEFCE